MNDRVSVASMTVFCDHLNPLFIVFKIIPCSFFAVTAAVVVVDDVVVERLLSSGKSHLSKEEMTMTSE